MSGRRRYENKHTKTLNITAVYSIPNSGSDYDKEKNERFLKINKRYEVKEINMGQSSTTVVLEQYPDIHFNSVSLYFYVYTGDKYQPINIYKSIAFNSYISPLKLVDFDFSLDEKSECPIGHFDSETCKNVIEVIKGVVMKRIEKLADLFANLITRNDDRPFNEVWEMYFKPYHEQFGIGNMNTEEVEKWLLEEVRDNENYDN